MKDGCVRMVATLGDGGGGGAAAFIGLYDSRIYFLSRVKVFCGIKLIILGRSAAATARRDSAAI